VIKNLPGQINSSSVQATRLSVGTIVAVGGIVPSSSPGQGSNSQSGPVRPANDPSGHTIASIVHATSKSVGTAVSSPEALSEAAAAASSPDDVTSNCSSSPDPSS